jgi:hypothetical protein
MDPRARTGSGLREAAERAEDTVARFQGQVRLARVAHKANSAAFPSTFS